MTYIWNRAERVPKEKMPETVVTAYNDWAKGEYKRFELVSDRQKKKAILQTIKRQSEKCADALAKHQNDAS